MPDHFPVLLMHGAWYGHWAWDELLPHLRERGHQVSTVDLLSSGGTGDLQADVEVVRAALDAIGEPTILVGHSYGGIPISEASAGRSDIAHLVYVCAFQLDVGGSLLGGLGGEAPPWIAIDAEHGTNSVPEPMPVFFGDVDPATATACAARLTTQSLSSFSDELTGGGWHDVPSTHVACTEDQAIPYPAQQAMSQRAATVDTLESSHSPFLSHPARLAEIISNV